MKRCTVLTMVFGMCFLCPTLKAALLTDGPGTVALWHMDGTNGSAPSSILDDDSANPERNSDLVLSNGPVIATGHDGQALQFDGYDDKGFAAAAWKGATNVYNELKVDFWFRPTISSGASQYMAYAFTDKLVWDIRLVNGKISFYTVSSANVFHLLESSTTYTVNEWHHLICSIDAAGNKVLNLDGSLTTVTADPMRFRDANITVGLCDGRTDRSFTGLLDEISIAHVVPEPTTMVILAIGGISLLLKRKK